LEFWIYNLVFICNLVFVFWNHAGGGCALGAFASSSRWDSITKQIMQKDARFIL